MLGALSGELAASLRQTVDDGGYNKLTIARFSILSKPLF
jgi:hypothetical protein